MKLPRDLSGAELAKALSKVGYSVTRQTGSHLRLTTPSPTRHHITVADMGLRIIKTPKQHHRYLDEARRLARLDPDPGTPEGARLQLLARLVEDYEKERFKFDRPDPVEIYSDKRIGEFDAAEADIGKLLRRKKNAMR